jgi:hypothetical protein
MKDLLQLAWDALLFRHEAYAQHAARADVLKRGLTVLILVTLLAGVISLIVNFVGDLRSMDVEAQRQEAEQGIQDFIESMESMGQFSDLPPDFDEQILKYIRPNMEMGFRIAALDTPLPKLVGRLLADLGAFLSLPFSRLAGWIGYSIWVLLVAKLLGGRATAPQMLGATALYAVPHVLDVLNLVPCLGGLLGLVATVWGIAIYVKALAVVNGFSIGRAVVATLVPALVIGALATLGMLGLLILAMATG